MYYFCFCLTGEDADTQRELSKDLEAQQGVEAKPRTELWGISQDLDRLMASHSLEKTLTQRGHQLELGPSCLAKGCHILVWARGLCRDYVPCWGLRLDFGTDGVMPQRSGYMIF